jgi:Uma2 family endonuclease
MQNYALDYIDDPFVEESIDGKIYMMARPNAMHLMIEGNLLNIFNSYFRQNKRKCTAVFEMQLYVNDKNYVQPDLMIYCKDNNEKKNKKIPLIVIEVLSESTWKKDVTVKLQKYAELGIEQYWIIDRRTRRISIYQLAGGKYELGELYNYPLEDEFSIMPEIRAKQKAEVTKEFSSPFFPDLAISLEGVFNLDNIDLI